MITITLDKIWESVLYSWLLGLSCGLIYFTIELAPLLASNKRRVGGSPLRIKRSSTKHFIDFIFFLSLGIAFLLLNYAFCDGIISLYSIASLLASFLIAQKILQKIVKTRTMFSKIRKK